MTRDDNWVKLSEFGSGFNGVRVNNNLNVPPELGSGWPLVLGHFWSFASLWRIFIILLVRKHHFSGLNISFKMFIILGPFAGTWARVGPMST